MQISARVKIALVAATALSAVDIASAFAADTADQAMGEIVVTARRVEERLQDVPISISVVSQQEIENRNIVNSADLGLFTPSLSVEDRFGPEKASFTLRGFNQDLYTQPTVGVYFADVLAPISADATNAGNGVGIGALFDLQNVQVLKGPQGTLFGRNTDGGSILLVPVKPTDKFQGYVEGSVGNYNMKRIQAVVNVPVNDKVRMRFDVDHMVRDGYEINQSGIGPNRFANVDFVSLRWSTVIDVSDKLENYTIMTYSNSHDNGFVDQIAACNPAFPLFGALACAQLAQHPWTPHNWNVQNSDPLAKNDQKQWQWINTTTWNANDAFTVKNIASYELFFEALREELYGDDYANPFVPGSTSPLLSLIQIGNAPGFDNASQSTASEELRFTGKVLDGRLDWQAGGYLEESNPLGYDLQETQILASCTNPFAYQCSSPLGAFGVPASQSIPFIKNHFSTKGLYAQGTYKFTDQFSATAGFRYTWDKTSQYYASTENVYLAPNTPLDICQLVHTPAGGPIVIAEGNFAPCATFFAVSSSAPTWEVDVDYKPTDATLVYAKYARGYRAGGVAGLNPAFDTWNPEHVDDFELGTKDSFNGAVRGYIDLNLFYDNFRNQEINASVLSANTSLFVGGSAEINAGHSRIWGAELDGSIEPFKGFTVNVGYAYLNTKILSLSIPPIPASATSLIAALIPSASVGQGLTLSPKDRLNVTGTYILPLPENIGQVSFSATYTHTDQQLASTASDPAIEELPAENLINLNLNWKDVAQKPFDLSVFVTNLANKYFWLNVGNAYPAFGAEYVVPNEPRMFGARLRFHFG